MSFQQPPGVSVTTANLFSMPFPDASEIHLIVGLDAEFCKRVRRNLGQVRPCGNVS